VTVEAVALDAYSDDPQFDVVLMDIEGSEYFALQGMQRILGHASALVVEFLPDHLRDVSGVTVEQFLAVIPPRFRTLRIPSRRLTVEANGFSAVLNQMFERGEKDYGLIFATGGASEIPPARAPASR
jgi:hypothetical protein